MEIAHAGASLISEIIKLTFRPIKRGISYVFFHEEKLKNFEKKVESLMARKERVQREVAAAENNGEKIHTDVNSWLIKVDAEVKVVEDLRDKAKTKCFIGLCPNLKSLYQLSRIAEKKAIAADELLQQGEFDKVSYCNVPQSTKSAAYEDFEAFDSRKQVFHEIVEAVKDPNIKIIGVYGMPGVGKTNLVKEVMIKVKEKLSFDSVVFAAVTHTPDIREIQFKIAESLGLNFVEQSVTGRASRLCQRLKDEGKVLVVLDDLWASLDLTEVGIPSGDEHKGCTILLTSRDVNVVSKEMEALKVFQIGTLKQEEAWKLFKKVAGKSVESLELQHIAVEIAKKCAGLPITISTVARTLRNKSVFVWKEALRQLNYPSSSNFSGVLAEAYSAIELSFTLVEKDAKVADELLRHDVLDIVSYRDFSEPVVLAPSQDFETFDSRKQVFHGVMEAVKDPNIKFIEVYGMPGVGKTTFVREVVAQVKEKLLFNSVVFAAVTHTPDIQEIQDQIAEMLGLKLEEKSTTRRASRLCERLKKEKKILVVLDDIWGRLDLKEVGIPFEIDECQGCTLLLTSTDPNVLKMAMGANKSFPIGILQQEEAWDLFKKIAGEGVESPDLWPIATEVAKKCGGLPVAINALARSLRDKPSFVWKDALRRLNKPLSKNFRGVPQEVYSAIKVSYDNLQSEEHKQTFLLCSVMGHDAHIQLLLNYAIGLGFFHGVTIEKKRNRLLTVVSDLKASCLLLNGHNNQLFDMHDLICEVALFIASEDNSVFALRHNYGLIDWPEEETMKEWDKLYLDCASISQLPDKLKCPILTFLRMDGKDHSLKMPTSFFKETENLQVLDLTKMDLPALPSSISVLSNLQTLCLDQCVLGDISLIGELKNLEILSLMSSEIEMLPKEIGQLIKLKLFDLSHCSKLKRIPSGIFCKLNRLEELYMVNSFVQWEAEEHINQQNNASLAELTTLSCLTVLDVHIPNAQIIPTNFSFEKLRSYNILIGEGWDWGGVGDIEHSRSRTLKLKLQTSIGFLNNGIKVLLKKVENLYLDEMTGLKILLHESEAKDYFLELKNLHIQNGAMIQHILKGSKIEFSQLQSLTLQNLPKLISFCSGNDGSTSISPPQIALFNQKVVFPKLEKLKLSSIGIESIWPSQGFCSTQNLTSLIIEGCPNLKRVISYSSVGYLKQLKCLEIAECKSIQEIISTE